jgi:hypothetical protein
MKKLLLPILLAVLGVVGGAGAGWYLKPAPPSPAPEPCFDEKGVELEPEVCADRRAAEAEAAMAEPTPAEPEGPAPDFFKFDRPFVVPLMAKDRVGALMVTSLSVEVENGRLDQVGGREPRLRDALLRVLFDHAYAGGFEGDFTADYVMKDLRRNLLTAARKVAGSAVRDVLVVDIYRQDP